jgi:hypothetical protein
MLKVVLNAGNTIKKLESMQKPMLIEQKSQLQKRLAISRFEQNVPRSLLLSAALSERTAIQNPDSE